MEVIQSASTPHARKEIPPHRHSLPLFMSWNSFSHADKESVHRVAEQWERGKLSPWMTVWRITILIIQKSYKKIKRFGYTITTLFFRSLCYSSIVLTLNLISCQTLTLGCKVSQIRSPQANSSLQIYFAWLVSTVIFIYFFGIWMFLNWAWAYKYITRLRTPHCILFI